MGASRRVRIRDIIDVRERALLELVEAAGRFAKSPLGQLAGCTGICTEKYGGYCRADEVGECRMQNKIDQARTALQNAWRDLGRACPL
jgi:hypothetical protein